MNELEKRRFTRLRTFLAAAFLLFFGVLSASAAPEADEPASSPAARKVEAQTREILAEMEKRLAQGAARSWPEGLRSQLIRLSMEQPLAPFTRDALSLLGNSKQARYGFFFLMPAVRWMCEPFLYPVELSGKPLRQAREMARIFGHLDRLALEGVSASLDNVGDASLTPDSAAEYRNYYRTLARGFAARAPGDQLYFSVKLSALVYGLDAAPARRQEIIDSLTGLLHTAAQAETKKIFFRLDMEEYAYKDLTISIYKEMVEKNRDLVVAPDGSLRLGLVVQAYLRDSAGDLADLADWARSHKIRVPVRLVKGAYERYEKDLARSRGQATAPVFNFKSSTDANYEALSAYLMANTDAFVPAFATHNLRSIAHVMALARVLGVGKEQFELQMLTGMGEPIQKLIVRMAYPLRIYVPAGSLARGLGYAGRRFHELANADNALARTLHGDFSVVDTGPPAFAGPEDVADGKMSLDMAEESLARLPGPD